MSGLMQSGTIYYYHGFDRYGNINVGENVFVAVWDDKNRAKILNLLSELEAGDMDAYNAGNKIIEMEKQGEITIGCDSFPVKALEICYDKILETL